MSGPNCSPNTSAHDWAIIINYTPIDQNGALSNRIIKCKLFEALWRMYESLVGVIIGRPSIGLPSHYHIQCWITDDWTLRNFFLSYINYENCQEMKVQSESVIWKYQPYLFRPQSINCTPEISLLVRNRSMCPFWWCQQSITVRAM